MMCTRVFLSIAFCAASIAVAQNPDPATQPDNTKTNQRDRDPNQPTADQQKNDRSDRMLTKNIRRSLMADKSLSTNAHNLKIISQNGIVTVKGPVNSDDERRSVIAKAVAVAGSADKVTDQISVKQ
jgi:hyperosmotically inducible periplasmic protein